ncbi:hypothetical protein [Kitasatospora sp. HPMI-4]|uniref:hypothetical protein n=1 Tax=Kitasatospora sp. HPMI-4 TaxID=3448443 RepID=UPI003F1D7BAB
MNEINLIQPTALQPQPLAQPYAAPLVPAGQVLPGVYTITGPDGSVHHVYGPAAGGPVLLANTALPAAETTRRPLVHPWMLNLALGSGALLALALGLHLLVGFVIAITQLVTALAILAAILFGGYVAFQLLGVNRGAGRGGNVTNVNIKKAVFKRSTFGSGS